VIPSKLGYGETGAGADIGPNQTLVFDMKLVSVAPPAP
jgi:FKBP-type peptidyl-prolyl cis-trans isomerase